MTLKNVLNLIFIFNLLYYTVDARLWPFIAKKIDSDVYRIKKFVLKSFSIERLLYGFYEDEFREFSDKILHNGRQTEWVLPNWTILMLVVHLEY